MGFSNQQIYFVAAILGAFLFPSTQPGNSYGFGIILNVVPESIIEQLSYYSVLKDKTQAQP